MDKYDNLGIIGEGSYGVVIKCKHKQSGQVRNIKHIYQMFLKCIPWRGVGDNSTN